MRRFYIFVHSVITTRAINIDEFNLIFLLLLNLYAIEKKIYFEKYSLQSTITVYTSMFKI